MSAKILPFPQPDAEPSLAERMAARKALRATMKALARRTIADAFKESIVSAGSAPLYISDVANMFASAMRRELKRCGPIARGVVQR